MTCENNFCIYWNQNTCLLDHVSLNGMGFCDACILVDFSETQLEKARTDLRNRLEKRWQP